MNPRDVLRKLFVVVMVGALMLPGRGVALAATCDEPASVPGLRVVVEAFAALSQLYFEPVGASDLLLAAAESARATVARSGPGGLLPDPPKSFGNQATAPAFFADYYCRLYEAAGDNFPDTTDVAYTSIRTMTSTLNEAHTQFHTPAMYRAELASSSGNDGYEGIGARLRSGPLAIESVFPGSPAEDAGVRAGDQIVSINGLPAANMTAEDAVGQVRGEAGTTVTLEVRRTGVQGTLTFGIVRAAIRVPLIVADVVEGMGYLRITSFPSTRIDLEVAENLASFEAQGAKGLILDLRGNPGGRLDIGTRIASLMLPNGAPLYRETTRSGRTTARASSTGPIWSKPIVVLIDGDTASMGELLASALKEQAGATLIGSTTAGAVAGSIFVPLSDGSAMQVTTLRIDSGLGALLNVVGLQPDITIPRPDPAVQGATDPARDAALNHLRTRTATPTGAWLEPIEVGYLPLAA